MGTSVSPWLPEEQANPAADAAAAAAEAGAYICPLFSST